LKTESVSFQHDIQQKEERDVLMKLKMDYKWVALSVTSVGSFMSALDEA